MNKIILENIENEKFSLIFDMYEDTIALKSSQKKKKSDETQLLSLDRWYQNELHEVVRSRKQPHINLDELVKIMKWKLLRGKWRPRLLEFAQSNSTDLVRQVTERAFNEAMKSNIEDAVEELCKLKGVGPATASAILAAYVPTKCGFFADEVAELFLEGKLKYTLNEYLKFNEELNSVTRTLNSEGPDETWTPHKVEIVIWTYCINFKINPEINKTLFSKK